MGNRSPHNHITRDIKPPGVCPGCDVYHKSREEGHRAEPSNGGESLERAAEDVAQRTILAQQLEAAGHGGCADDLEAAGDRDAAQVAYDIAEHVAMACGCPREQHPTLADALRSWADAHEKLTP